MQHSKLDLYRKYLDEATSIDKLYQAIVNTPFIDELEAAHMFLGIVVLLLVDTQSQTINRVALSDTRLAKNTLKMTVKPFNDIKIPLGYHDNIIAEAIASGSPVGTTDWRYLFEPILTPEEARFNQAGGGIGYSAVHPILLDALQGALIFSYYQYPEQLQSTQKDFMQHYTSLVSEYLASQSR
ncbi:MAG: hypothetical protein NVS1B7_6700 [Candidatus Saccharimonadales bacterium]